MPSNGWKEIIQSPSNHHSGRSVSVKSERDEKAAEREKSALVSAY